jgi:TolA-binding protein
VSLRATEGSEAISLLNTRLLRRFAPRNDKCNNLRVPCVWVFLYVIFFTSSGFAADKQISTSSTTLDFANGLYARGMYASAITEYDKFLKANPASPELASARFRYADSYYFTKDYASAIAQFELFLKDFPADKRVPMAEFRLGTTRYYRGDTARALRIFRKLSQTSEDPVVKSGSVFYLAKCLENKGKGDRSLRILQGLAKRDTQSEYASYAGVAIGDFYLKAGNYPEAVNGYRIAADNGNPPELARQARFKNAEILFRLKNYPEAAVYYEKIFEEPAEEKALLDPQKKNRESLKDKSLLGLFYCDYNLQNLETAERRFSSRRPAVAASAYKSEIIFLLAGLLSDKGRHGDALAKLEEILADTDAEPSLKEKAKISKMFEETQVLADKGKTDEALLNYQKIIADFPDSDTMKTALFHTGMTAFKAGRMDLARENLRKYAETYPAETNADLALLQLLQIDLNAKNFKEAFKGTEEFIKNHPQSEFLDIGYYKLGVATTGLKRFNHAAFAFNKILERFPDSKLYAESLYGAATSLENGNHRAKALLHYEKLLAAYPDHVLSQEVWTRLGYLYIQDKQVEKASTLYQDLVFNRTKVPIEPDGVFWLIQHFLDSSDYAALDKILEALPGRFPEKDLKHETFFFKAESAMGKKDYTKATEYYLEAIKTKPEGAYAPHSYLGLGIAQAALGDDLAAEKNLNEVLKYDSELKITLRARFEMANLRLKTGDVDGAAKAFMLVAVLFDDPKYTPTALYKAGECFRSVQKLDESEKAFVELRNRYPESDWARKAATAAQEAIHG